MDDVQVIEYYRKICISPSAFEQVVHVPARVWPVKGTTLDISSRKECSPGTQSFKDLLEGQGK